MIIKHKAGNNIFDVEVIGFKKDRIIVNANLKSVYYVSMNDFSETELEDIKSGITKSFLVFIHNIDPLINKSKVASHKFAKQEDLWQEVLKIKGEQKSILGKIISATKGGYNVLLDIGINAFLPTSHLESNIRNSNETDIVNSSLELCIIGVNKLHRNIVVSRKEVINQRIISSNKDKVQDLKPGIILDGVVRGMYSGGLFVNVGIDYVGLVSIEEALFNTDIGLQKIYSMGQQLKLYVVSIENKNRKIFLSVNKCIENPIYNYKNNQVIDVVFYKINKYEDEDSCGRFIVYCLNEDNLLCKLLSEACIYSVKEIEEKIETSEKIKVVIKNVDINNMCIHVVVKRSKDELWQDFAHRYAESNDKVFWFKVIGKSKYAIFLYSKGIGAVLPINEVDVCNTDQVFANIRIGDKLDVFVVIYDIESYHIVVTRRFLKLNEAKQSIEELAKKTQVLCKILYSIGLRVVVSVEGILDVVIHSRKIGALVLNLLKEGKEVSLYFVVKNIDNLSVMLFDKHPYGRGYRKEIEQTTMVQENTLEEVSLEYAQLLKEINIAEGIEGSTEINDDIIIDKDEVAIDQNVIDKNLVNKEQVNKEIDSIDEKKEK